VLFTLAFNETSLEDNLVGGRGIVCPFSNCSTMPYHLSIIIQSMSRSK
jgi:hypothetical protein